MSYAVTYTINVSSWMDEQGYIMYILAYSPPPAGGRELIKGFGDGEGKGKGIRSPKGNMWSAILVALL